MTEHLSIRKFNIREANWNREGNVLSNIRRLVFIVEQNVPETEEWDGRDSESWHWLATDNADRPIGTARLLPTGQIGRMAVFQEFRGTGVGAALLEAAVNKARHLGFDAVTLNAQAHAEGFYQRAGFSAEGEQFEEAGIRHVTMTQTLAPLDDNVQRFPQVSNGVRHASQENISVKNFDTREASFTESGKIIKKIREIVLVHELGLPSALITDDSDANAYHWVAEDNSGQIVGSVRMSLAGEVSRLVVMSEHRHKGVGQTLLELVLGKAVRFGFVNVKLDALEALADFYEQADFVATGQPFEAHGLMHQAYVRHLETEDVHDAPIKSSAVSDHYSDSDIVYGLGADKKLILLRREEDFRNVIIEMTRQASTSIRIYSPVLDHKLFDNEQLVEICSALARRNRYTHIEVLLHDSHRIVKNGHGLLSLSRKLSSSITMKIVHPELRRLNHEYVLVDGIGIVYRLDYEVFDGYANFNDVTECNRLNRQFTSAWESGLYDPNLRQLRI